MTLPALRSHDPLVQSVLNALAEDHVFSFGSLFDGVGRLEFGDGLVRKVLQGVTNEFLTVMQVGAYNEDWRELGVALTSEPSLAIFNFFDLTQLTRDFVSDSELQRTLLLFLKLADGPDARDRHHQIRWLDAYIGVLVRFRGVEVPLAEADALIQIAASLKEASNR